MTIERYALLLAVVVTAGLCGCMHTELGGNPEPSPDNQYAISTRAYGASGQPYSAQTKKRFRVWIGARDGRGSTHAFKKTYEFIAGEMGWKVNWHDSDEVVINLYDGGGGMGTHRTGNLAPPSNHVASIVFRKGPDGHFAEVN